MLDLKERDATAAVDAATGAEISFRTLLRRGQEAVGRIGERSLLVLLSRNEPFTASTYAAALANGHAVALVDAAQPAAATAQLAAAYRPAWIAGAPGLGELLAREGVPVERTFTHEGGETIELGHERPRLHPDLAVLLSTSGTTGTRKFVRLSRRNVESNATAIAAALGITAADRPITSLPLHYTFGLSVLNSHWSAGAAVVLNAESVIQRSFWEAFDALGCTSIAGVPYTFAMLERIGFRTMALPTLTTMQQAGGALDPGLAAAYGEHMRIRDGRLFVMYGQTEATARMAWVPPDRLPDKSGSAGIAIPGGHLRIDPEGAHLVDGRLTGEILYQGPNVMLGYALGAEDLALGDTLGGTLHTGDIGYLDDEGYLFIVGRSKRIAKVFGLRVNLDEVEALLREHGPVAAVGGDDVIWAFCAFGTPESVAALADDLARRMRVHRSAIQLRAVDEIPTTGSGKVDYQQVQRWTTN